MATLREYFDTDFNYATRFHVRVPFEGEQLEAAVLFDFAGYFAFMACYVPGKDRQVDFFQRLMRALEYGKTQVTLDGKVTLPSARQHPGELRVENTENFQILSRYFGDTDWVSSKDISASKRLFIYTEADLSEEQVRELKKVGLAAGLDLQMRTAKHAAARAKLENPLAFISHDSRDKDTVARKLAINLQRMMCPVWYDEFSLKVGDHLRESIEKGLKECRKCILILSPSFLSNNGWTKKEFDSIFTRELLEEKHLVLPLWVDVTKEQVYAYSPSLLNVKALIWAPASEEEICRQLYQAIVEDDK